MTGRERVDAVLGGRGADRLPSMPITMMFASDLSGIAYHDYVTDHRRLVECQLRVAETFGFDYVSCISDPTREATDCGAAVRFFSDQPPAMDESRALLADKAVLAKLAMPDPLGGGRMHDRVRAAAMFGERVKGDLIIEGWIEGPCAEAADLRGINTLMLDFYDDPPFVRDLFDFAVEMELAFARAQVEAGVDLMGVGDAAASLVGPAIYDEFVWPAERKLVEGLRAMGTMVRLHICGDTRRILEGMGRLGCEIIDLDWMVPLSEGRRAMGPDQVLLGNVDPVAVVRNGSPEGVYAALEECHRQAGARYIVGAGCEIPRDAPHANVEAMRSYASDHS